MNKTIFAVLAGGLLATSICRAESEKQDNPVSTGIKSTMVSMLQDMEKEDMEKVLSAYHAESSVRPRMQLSLRMLFAGGDVKHELVSFALIGTDADYAYARVIQKSTILKKAEGDKPLLAALTLVEGTSDAMFVFKQQDKVWKVWHTLMLSHTPKS